MIFEENEGPAVNTGVINSLNISPNVVLLSGSGKEREETKNSSQLSFANYNIQQLNMSRRTPMEDRYGNKERMDTNTVSSHLRNRDSILQKDDEKLSEFSIKPSRKIGGSSAL